MQSLRNNSKRGLGHTLLVSGLSLTLAAAFGVRHACAQVMPPPEPIPEIPT
jgi:hypothetical protein